MTRLFLLLFPCLFAGILFSSCKDEQVSFVAHTLNYNPYEADTTGTVGGLSVDLNITLLETNLRKSHVGDINRQLIDRFIGNANLLKGASLDPLPAMKHYQDSLLALPLAGLRPVVIATAPVPDSLAAAPIASDSMAPRFTASVKIWPETLDERLVTFVCENFENYHSGITSSYFLAFDLKTGRQLHEQDLFDCSKSSRAAIDGLLLEALKSQIESDTTGRTLQQYHTDLLHMNDNFRILAQSLVYHFDAGVLAAPELGPVDLEIPSFQLHPYLSKESLLNNFWFKE